MFIDLVATISAGFALAGITLVLRALTRHRLPAWIIPAAAGLGMLGFAIWNEYTWYPRTVAALPEGVVVARARQESAVWRPWTYVRPIVTRFSAVDTRMNRTNPDAAGRVLTTVLLVGRWQPGVTVPVIFDCETSRRAPLTGDTPLPETARSDLDWEEIPSTDELLRIACG